MNQEERRLPIEVRVAEQPSERAQVQRFRDSVASRAAVAGPGGLGLATRYAIDPLDDAAALIYARLGSEVKAAVAVWPGDALQRLPTALHAHLEIDRFVAQFGAGSVTVLSDIVVQLDRSGSIALDRLLGRVYQSLIDAGIQVNLCAATPATIGFFESLGYSRYTRSQRHPGIGNLIPGALLCFDDSRLAACHSPFRRLLENRRPGQLADTARLWLETEFPRSRPVLTPATEGDRFWNTMAQALATRPTSGAAIFDEITEPERHRIVEKGTLRQLAFGERLFAYGDPGRQLFLVLSGGVTLRHGVTGLPIAVVTPGEVVGEIEFLSGQHRMADSVAVEASEVLSFDQTELARLTAREPILAARFFTNLARILAERLTEAGYM